MADRTDIDALLVGALYGELTPADEARLAAHLESHPGDRTALTELTRTRDAVRESRIFAQAADPPQAISALLLQEASRRAPRAPSRDPESPSWFQRLFRSTLVAHPAMSAAATLVLVAGVAGTLYMRGTGFVESEPPAVTAAAPAATELGPAAAPAAEPAGAAAATAAGSAGTDSYRVDVDQAGQGKPAAGTVVTASSDQPVSKSEALAKSASKSARKELATAQLAEDTERAKPAAPGPGKLRGIELHSPEPQPKELPDRARPYDESAAAAPPARSAGAPATGAFASAPGESRQRAAADEAPRAPAAAPADTERASGGVLADTPPPPPTATAALEPAPVPTRKAQQAPSAKFAPPREAAPGVLSQGNAAQPLPGAALLDDDKVARRAAPTGAGAPAPAAPPSNAPASASPAAQDRRASNALSDKRATDPAVLDWARKQRDQVVALVAANNCRAAAATAIEIYRRAPDYYAANVATDRAIRPCWAYLNTERERDDRKRAVRNNSSSEAPANAAPPARK